MISQKKFKRNKHIVSLIYNILTLLLTLISIPLNFFCKLVFLNVITFFLIFVIDIRTLSHQYLNTKNIMTLDIAVMNKLLIYIIII